jgi:hypothetical protein
VVVAGPVPGVDARGVDGDLDVGVLHALRDAYAALEAVEAAVYMGHADVLGDEADGRVRRVEEPGPRGRQLGAG